MDERQDLGISTRGALFSLEAAWEDPVLRESGAAVQLAILSHNAGYDNSRFEERRVNRINILPAYRRYLKKTNLSPARGFCSKNITCSNLKQKDYESISAQCGGVLWNHTQHYGYNIVAQHLLAVCYYGKNYGKTPSVPTVSGPEPTATAKVDRGADARRGGSVVSMRTILSVASLVMFVGVAIFLLSKEDIVPPEVTASHVALQVDPLLDTRYLGLGSETWSRLVYRTRWLPAQSIGCAESRTDTRKIGFSGRLCRPQCGRDGDVWADQPDSSAVQRHAILSRRGSGSAGRAQGLGATGIEQQDWSQLSPISDVYTRAELSDGREEDATLMAIAAIMTGKSRTCSPDTTHGEADSCRVVVWEKVVELHPGIEERVIEYFALMHLFVEQATSDGGICGEEEG